MNKISTIISNAKLYVVVFGVLLVSGMACTCALCTPEGSSPSTRQAATFPVVGLKYYKVQPAYDKAIKQFETAATTQPVKIGGTVFIGSSSFTRWKTLEKDMAKFNAVNRGFGGSKTDDLLYYAQRILKPLAPTRIVYYCGGNDVDKKRTVDIVVGNIRLFTDMVRSEFPGLKIYYISTNYTPKRIKITDEIRQVNQAIEQWAKTQPDVFYIYAMDGLIDAQGKANPKLFMPDGVHLNPDGNKIWMANIAKGMDSNW